MAFASETTVKAVRKRHRCDGCNRFIEIGEPATRWSGMTDGDFAAVIYHPDCRQAEVDMNLHIMGHQYGDDWCGLSDIEDEDRPWLLGSYPAVAERMGFALHTAPTRATTERSARPREANEPLPAPTEGVGETPHPEGGQT